MGNRGPPNSGIYMKKKKKRTEKGKRYKGATSEVTSPQSSPTCKEPRCRINSPARVQQNRKGKCRHNFVFPPHKRSRRREVLAKEKGKKKKKEKRSNIDRSGPIMSFVHTNISRCSAPSPLLFVPPSGLRDPRTLKQSTETPWTMHMNLPLIISLKKTRGP